MPATPLTARRLNRSHALLRGSTNAWLPIGPISGAHGFWDILDSNQAVLTNGPTWRNTALGPGVETGVVAANAYIDLNNIGLNRGWSMFMAYTYRYDGSTSGSSSETGILHSQGHSIGSGGVSFRHGATTLDLLKSHVANLASIAVTASAGEFHTAGFVITTNTITLYYDGRNVKSVSDTTAFGSSGTTTLGYDADPANPEYGRHTHLGAILWAGYTVADSDALAFHLAARERWRPLLTRRRVFPPAAAPAVASQGPLATPMRPSLPNWGAVWLRNLPHTPLLSPLPPGVSPTAQTPQVLPPPVRIITPAAGAIWLKHLPETPMPMISPPSRDSVDIQKYPPPVRLFFPLVPLLGFRSSGSVMTTPTPPINPPAPPLPQILPPPISLFTPRFGQVWLAHLRPTPMPADPVFIPPPPGPAQQPAKPYFQRVPDNMDTRRLGRLTDMISSSLNSLVGHGQLRQVGPTDWKMLGTGIEAARPPGVNDDSSADIPVGVVWIDTTAQQAYVNISNAVGSAVWRPVGGGGGGGGGGTGWTGTG